MLNDRRYNGATIGDYYSNAAQRIRADIMERDDDYVLNVDTAEYAEYLLSQYGLPHLVVRDDAVTLHETKAIEAQPNRFGQAIQREVPIIEIRMPLEPAERIEIALALLPSTTWTTMPEIDLDGGTVVGRLRNPTADEVGSWRGQVHAWLRARNDDVEKMSPDLRKTSLELIEKRKRDIAEKRSKFNEIAKTLGVPLVRKDDAPGRAVSIATRRSIAAKRVPPAPKRPEEYRLSDSDLAGVIDEIIRICRPWEVTPAAYRAMEEEQLRDIIVGLLNHVYDVGGVATGEAFRKQGKTDIQLTIRPGAVFTAECKWWSGPKAYAAALDQLFGYVTWRDNDAALITFVREKGFTEIVTSAKDATAKHPSARDAMRTVSESHFVSRHARSEDAQRVLNIHHLLFTLPRTR